MALIRCPGCRQRVSSRAEACAHCGARIAGAGPGDEEAARRASGRRGGSRLKIQLLLAFTLFVAGSLWLIFTDLRGEARAAERVAAATLAGAGLLWYVGVRLLVWLRRR